MTTKTLSNSDLAGLVADLLAAKMRVVAPVRAQKSPQQADYRPIHCFEDAALGGPLPRRSLKELFLPASEVLFRYRQKQDGVELEEVTTTFPPQVVLGARPCDAAGAEILDKVMGWDYRDELWFGRREATTIVSLACPGVDGSCFCSAVGLGPDAARGSDLLLVPIEGGYLAKAVTSKGQALFNVYSKRFQEAKGADQAEAFLKSAREKVVRNLPAVSPRLSGWIAKNFDHDYWKGLALRCHGCGACASVCPTCHCFDIVDEPEGSEAGARRRNWDFCQTGKFTLHATGHNPRETQTERFRQRVLHKFSIYPRRFQEVLCTGCGRCARACPAGMDLPEILGQLAGLAGGSVAGGAR